MNWRNITPFCDCGHLERVQLECDRVDKAHFLPEIVSNMKTDSNFCWNKRNFIPFVSQTFYYCRENITFFTQITKYQVPAWFSSSPFISCFIWAEVSVSTKGKVYSSLKIIGKSEAEANWSPLDLNRLMCTEPNKNKSRNMFLKIINTCWPLIKSILQYSPSNFCHIVSEWSQKT